jgi:hypothetical protein
MKMKTKIIIAFAAISLLLPQLHASPVLPEKIYSLESETIKWKSTDINLGDISHGKPVDIYFEFTNNSDKPVIITNVQASCGCTVASYDKMPIGPGEKSSIKATFNAAAVGSFKKTLTVTTSADPSPVVLSFSGNVSVLK